MRIREQLAAAIGSQRGTDAANSLCRACVGLLEVDEAAISLIFDGTNSGTLGASSAQAWIYDELQFTLGEGPCLASVEHRRPVVVVDLADAGEVRWPGYAAAMLTHRIHSVYAMPVVLAGEYIGALDLYRSTPGTLDPDQFAGALIAAELAELPLLDLLSDDLQVVIGEGEADTWSELASLTRMEISQATGMLIAQLDVEPTEALIRLRAHAYATNRSATEVARDILDNRLRLEADR